MNLAFNISIYVFLGILLFGIVMLGWFIYWIISPRDFSPFYPKFQKLPRLSFDESIELLKVMQEALLREKTHNVDLLKSDLRLLEQTLNEIHQRTKNFQTTYYRLCQQKSKTWESLHHTFAQFSFTQKWRRKHNLAYQTELRTYQKLLHEVEEEKEYSLRMDQNLLQELHKRGVYQRNLPLLKRADAPEAPAIMQDTNAILDSSTQELETPHPKQQTAQEIENPQECSTATDQAKQEVPDSTQGEESQELRIRLLPQSEGNQREIRQADFPSLGINIKEKIYVDPTFSLGLADHQQLQYYHFSESVFHQVLFLGIHRYEYCDFQKVNFSESRWEKQEQPHLFRYCNFTQANLSQSYFESVEFYYCNFTQAIWKEISLSSVKLIACDLSGVALTGLDFSQVFVSQDMLQKHDFSVCLFPPINAKNPEEQPPQAS